jgi:hypothetical protein
MMHGEIVNINLNFFSLVNLACPLLIINPGGDRRAKKMDLPFGCFSWIVSV